MVSTIYLVKRLGYMVLSLFGISVIAFVIFRIVPGDPALLMVGPTATQQEIEEMRRLLGLTDPLHIQYLKWLSSVFSGDLGTSIRFDKPVVSLILEYLPATIELVVFGAVLALILGIILGVVTAVKRGLIQKLGMIFSFLGFSIPHFLWGIIFIIIFGAVLRILPVSGRLDTGYYLPTITGFYLVDSLLLGRVDIFFNALAHIILPGMAIALSLIALVQRTLRSSLLEVMQQDYIYTDRMKGLSNAYILYVRALKNALIPTVTIFGVQFTFLMGGSIVVELIFGWQGLGSLIFTAVQYRDLPLIQGIVMTYALIVVIINLAIDLLYAYLNPKIRFG